MVNINPRLRRPLLLSLTALIAVFVIWAAVNALVFLQYRIAQQVTRDVVATSGVDADQLQTGIHAINRSLTFYPGHPDFLDTKGLLLEYSAGLPGVAGQERRDLLSGAAEQYRKAIRNRPLWPYSWANLVSVKDKLGEINDDYLHAFERSDTLGPWEPPVQLILIRSALLNWQELGSDERQRAEQIIGRAMQRQGKEVFELVRSVGRMDLLCPLQDDYPMLESSCI